MRPNEPLSVPYVGATVFYTYGGTDVGKGIFVREAKVVEILPSSWRLTLKDTKETIMVMDNGKNYRVFLSENAAYDWISTICLARIKTAKNILRTREEAFHEWETKRAIARRSM